MLPYLLDLLLFWYLVFVIALNILKEFYTLSHLCYDVYVFLAFVWPEFEQKSIILCSG